MDDGVSRAGESSPRVGDDTAETSAALHSFQLLVTPAEETSIVQAWDPNTGAVRRPHEGQCVQPTTHDKRHTASAANVGAEHPQQRGGVTRACGFAGPSGSVLTLRMPDEAGPSRNGNIVGGCGMCMSLQAVRAPHNAGHGMVVVRTRATCIHVLPGQSLTRYSLVCWITGHIATPARCVPSIDAAGVHQIESTPF